MNQPEREGELQRLEMVLQNIKSQLEQGQDRFRGAQKELRAALDFYWENKSANPWEQAQQTEAVNRQRSLTAATWRHKTRLEKMAESPYFGRIDFTESQPVNAVAPERIYIGIAALTDAETGKHLVYDWRSPVAGMFYDFEPGQAHYDCPIGTISGELTLKRQYKIIHGLIQSMFDTDLKIDDEILQEILGKSADAKMRTIVNSIQREQNRVIRDERHRLLLVQGPAGSGKTSIALHRAAYLLYLERNIITAKNILILSPNRIFSDYISGVLPELGEENVQQTTFRDFIFNFHSRVPAQFEERDAQLEYLFSSRMDAVYRNRVAAIRYKSSPEFTTVIRNYMAFLEEYLVRDCPEIKFQDRIILSREEWRALYQNNLAYLPPRERLAQIKHRVQVKLRPLVQELRREKELEIATGGEEVNEKHIKALARVAARKELDFLLAEVDRLTTLEPFALYRRLFEDEALFQRLTSETKPPGEWPEIRKQTLAWFERGSIPYEDSMPLLFFQGNLEGFPVRKGIQHLIIDEAQDYSVLHFELLKRFFPESTWTVLGDPDQSVHPYFQTVDINSIPRTLGAEDPISIRLGRSYRSTREIQAFCRGLLLNAESVDHINRPGPLPELVKARSPKLIADQISKKIREYQEEGWRSIAVLCKTAREAIIIYQELGDPSKLILITQETGEFHSGTLVIPVYLAKGLEFDAVLIADASSEVYAHASDRKLIYIACTRALHRLALFFYGETSPFIRALAPELYQILEE